MLGAVGNPVKTLKRRSSRQIMLVSPLAPKECLGRLTKVTSRRGYTAFFDKARSGLPDPLFRGSVRPDGFTIALFNETLGMNSFVPRVEVQVVPSPTGTAFAGSAGLSDDGWMSTLIIGLGMTLMGLLCCAVGTAALLSHGPVIFLPLGIAFSAGPWPLAFFGVRYAEQHTPALLSALTTALESSADTCGHRPEGQPRGPTH